MLARSGLPREARELVLGLQTLREDHVRAGLAVRLAAAHGVFEAAHVACVGARDDHEVAREPVARHGGHLLRHRLLRDEILAVEVAAPLGEHLVLHVERRRARALVLHHGAHAALHLAVAGVRVHDDRHLARVRDLPDRARHLREGHEPDVGEARDIGRRAARDVARGKARLRHRARDERVERARDHEGAPRPRVAQAAAGVGRT
jgi:hypothetical protein